MVVEAAVERMMEALLELAAMAAEQLVNRITLSEQLQPQTRAAAVEGLAEKPLEGLHAMVAQVAAVS